MVSELQGLYRQVIMEHYKSPRNKGLVGGDYHSVHLKNPSCGDDITIEVKFNGIIEDIRHDGVGCSICCSSASIMTEVLEGKTPEEAGLLINNFYEIVKGADYNKDLDMGDAIVYEGVSNFPARIKCATIPWKALETAIEEKTADEKTGVRGRVRSRRGQSPTNNI